MIIMCCLLELLAQNTLSLCSHSSRNNWSQYSNNLILQNGRILNHSNFEALIKLSFKKVDSENIRHFIHDQQTYRYPYCPEDEHASLERNYNTMTWMSLMLRKFIYIFCSPANIQKQGIIPAGPLEDGSGGEEVWMNKRYRHNAKSQRRISPVET